MTVDTRGTKITEFRIGGAERDALLERGRQAARSFLERWERQQSAPG